MRIGIITGILLAAAAVLAFAADEVEPFEFRKNSMCDWAKKEGAGSLDWEAIEKSNYAFRKARFNFRQWKQANVETHNKCFELGRIYGDISYEEMVDRHARESMSEEEYRFWRIERRLDDIEKKIAAHSHRERAVRFADFFEKKPGSDSVDGDV